MTDVITLRTYYWLPLDGTADSAMPGAFKWSGTAIPGHRNPTVEEMDNYRKRFITTEIKGDPAREYIALRHWERRAS